MSNLQQPDLLSSYPYSVLFDSLTVGVVFYDGNGFIFLANRAAQEILGLTPEQILGRTPPDSLWRAIHEDGSDFPGQDHPAMQALQTGQIVRDVVMGIYHPLTDCYKWINITATPQYKKTQMPVDIVMVSFEEVTSRKQVEESLRANEILFRALVENSYDAITLLGRDGRTIYQSPSVMRLTGFSMGETLNHDPLVNVYPEDLPALQAAYGRVFSRPGCVECLEFRSVRKDGTIWWTEATTTNLLDTPGVQAVVVNYRDVTERKEAELELFAAHRHITEILESICDAFYALDQNGCFTYINQKAADIWKMQPAGLLGKNIWEVFPSGKETESYRHIQQALFEKQPIHYESYSAFLDQWVEIHVYPTENGISVYFQDITERKRADMALLKSEATLYETQQRLQLAVRAANVGLWDWDLRTNQIYYSPEYKRILGYEADEFTNEYLSWESRVHPDDLEQVQEITRAFIAEPYPNYWSEFRMRHKDGSYRWIFAQASVIADEQGKSMRMLGLHIDITDRKQAELALFESRENYRSLVDSLDSAVFKADREGRYLFVNQVLARMMRLSQEQIVGKTFFDLLEPELAENRFSVIRKVLDSGVGLVEEAPIHYKNGVVKWFRGSIQPVFNTDGKAVQAVVSTTDITEIKKTQRRLEKHTLELCRANAELIRANQVKSEFLATMSHELRTPLNAVLTLSESLQEGVYGEVNLIQADRLGTIHRSGSHLLEIINEILDFSKLEAGHLELRPEAVDLDILCHATMQMVKPQATMKRLRISTTVSTASELIFLDPNRLKQILVNLLSNAIKFTPEGGSIGLEVSQGMPGNTVRFTIWDTGIGIADNQIGRLFQPFTQLDGDLNRQYGGTGLGLAFAQRLVDWMGGSIGVESEPGKGSKFWFILPVKLPEKVESTDHSFELSAEVPASPLQEADSQPIVEQDHRILIVEDQIDNLISLVDVLKAKGNRILTASNGIEAIERAQEFQPDIILMDIQMPVMDGLEATRRLRALPQFRQTRIIALTALVMPGDRERCLQAGANEYLVKPVNLQKMFEMNLVILGWCWCHVEKMLVKERVYIGVY